MMDSTRLLWSLYNTKNGRQIDGLTFVQVLGVVEAIIDERRDEWSAWHEGIDVWKPITEFQEFATTGAQPRKTPPKPPPVQAGEESEAKSENVHLDFDNEATRAQISLDQKKYSDRRANRRFLQTYQVQILTQGMTYSNETVDISLGGMSLAEDLPDTVPSLFSAKFLHPSGATVTIQCQRIADLNGVNGFSLRRAKFKLDINAEPVLRTWLFNAQTED